MKSNYQMLQLLSIEEWKPKRFGVLTNDEIVYLRDVFKISDRSDVELQNLRDFVVMYYTVKFYRKKPMTNSDIMSAICYVIDCEKVKRGMSV